MSSMSLNVSCLPFEILHSILRSASEYDLHNYALVCKAWLKPAQSLIYADVKIGNLKKLEKFHDNVKRNPQLGEHVKTLHLAFSETVTSHPLHGFERPTEEQIENAIERVSDLLFNGLPNLQNIPEYFLCTYSPVLRALQNSRLKMLKVLDSPYCYSKNASAVQKADFVSCILLMHDRVEKLVLRNPKESENDDLYNNLNQLSVLKEIEVHSRPNLFETFEYVTTSCKALRRLRLHCYGNISAAEIDTIVPIKYFEYLDLTLSGLSLLSYFMRKFPQPIEISLSLQWEVDSQKLEEFTRILDYLSGIRKVFVDRFTIDRRIPGVMAKYWDTVSEKLGSKTVEARYSDSCEQETYGLEINTGKEHEYTFHSHILKFDSQHVEVIDTLGKHIGEFHFSYSVEESDYDLPVKRDLPTKFMDHLFTRCPNLRALQFEGWVFRKRSIQHQKLPISELYFKECLIFGDYLTHLSKLLPQLNRLIIEQVSYCAKSVKTSSGYDQEYYFDNDPLQINMPRTRIETITFVRRFGQEASISHVKLFVTNEKTHYYYRQQGGLLSSDEKDYNSESALERIYICCVNKPKIQFR